MRISDWSSDVCSSDLRQLIHDGMVDEAYLTERTTGWDAVREAVEPFTPEEAERLSGVPRERIVAAARMYGESDPSLILHARGKLGRASCRARVGQYV